MLSGKLTNRRRIKQQEYNSANGITPESVKNNISDVLKSVYEMDYVTVATGISGDDHLIGHNYRSHLRTLRKRMKEAAGNLEFEEAARLRDEIRRLEGLELGLDKPGVSISAASTHGLGGSQKRNLDGSNSEKNLNNLQTSNRTKSKGKKNKNKLINRKKRLRS